MSFHQFAHGVRPSAETGTASATPTTEFPTFVFDKDFYRLGDRQFHPIVLRTHRRFNELGSGVKIVEVGGGVHRYGQLALQRDFGLVNYDISNSAFQGAQAAIRDLGLPDEAILADFARIPVEDLRRSNFQGAFSWRVLHTMSPEVRLATCRKVRDALPPGASFFVALLADTSWERVALEGGYAPDVPNDLREVMEFDRLRAMMPPEQRHLLPEHWLFTFFSEESARKLGEDTGFEVHDEVVSFQEANAWPHLSEQHPDQTWLFVEFRKPGVTGQDTFRPAFETPTVRSTV